jgi:O-antigen/teichoic acid export membrane protein
LIDQPDAAPPLQALAFVLPIAALGATHLSLRLREFGHKSLALRSVLAGTLGGAAAVAAAFAGWGVWALVVQRLVTEVVNTLMSWQAYRWVPGLHFSWRELRRIAGFGANVSVTHIIGLMQRRAQDVVIGATIGAAAVGIYRVAWRTSELITVGTIQPFTNVALQTLSRLQDDSAGVVKAYRWMVTTSSMAAFPALIGFGVIAPDAVPAIYGAKWAEAGQLAQIFAFLALPVPLASFAIPLLTALGRADSVRTQAIITMVLTVIVTLLAAPYGIFAVACAYVGRTYLTLPLQVWFTRRATGIRPRDTLAAIAAPLGASAVMAGGVWLFMELIRPHVPEPLIRIVLAVGVGAVVYAVALYLLSPEARHIARRAWSIVRGKR